MILKVHAAEGDKDPIITLDTPCIVAEVDRFGPACKAGIRQGDIIDEIDGEPLIGKKLKSVIALLESEQEERILIILRGKRQSIEIVLERGK